MQSIRSKYIGLLVGSAILLGGCAPSGFAGIPPAAPTRFVCPPFPTRTPDPRPTETPFVRLEPPTPAPSRTPGPPPTPLFTPAPTLQLPLDTKARVIAFLYAHQRAIGMEWQDPWCPELLELDPSRLDAVRFNSVQEAENTLGANSHSQEIEPAWVVTIRATIHMIVPGGPMTAKYMRQVIGEKTGNTYVAHFSEREPPPPLEAPKTLAPRKTRVPRTKMPRAIPTP